MVFNELNALAQCPHHAMLCFWRKLATSDQLFTAANNKSYLTVTLKAKKKNHACVNKHRRYPFSRLYKVTDCIPVPTQTIGKIVSAMYKIYIDYYIT